MATSPANLSGLFKEAYGDDIINLIPEAAKLVKMIKFVESSKETGNKYHQPVIVQSEQGVTYAAADAGAFTLEDAVSMSMQDAQVQGAQLLLRSALSYDVAARASNSKKAFVKSTELIVENMMESLTKRLEISMLYGQSGLGISSGSVNSTTTKTVIQFSAASWATGIWAGNEGANLQFYRVDNDALVSSGADAVFAISSIDADNRKLTVTGTTTGISAIDALTASPGVIPYFKGSKTSDMAGLKKIITNTGTLFNVSAADYNLWKGNSVSVSGQLTMSKLLSAISKAVQRGLNEDVAVLVNPDTWANLASDIAALRRYDGSYDKKESSNGSESICFYGQNGKIEIVAHNCVKAGDCFVFPPKRARRIGAQEMSFKRPGREDEIILELANSAGYEMRLYGDQALFVETPARCVYISGFTNS